MTERPLHDNRKIIGDETSRYLQLKELCERQQSLLRHLNQQVGFLKADLSEAVFIAEHWRDKYLILRYGTKEDLEAMPNTDASKRDASKTPVLEDLQRLREDMARDKDGIRSHDDRDH